MNIAPQIIKPRDLGFDPQRLERIPEFFSSYVEKGKLTGLAVLVARHGEVAHFSWQGQRYREEELPVEPDTIFRIYSMTKPICSLGLMMLHEEGRFELTHEVSRYLPELKNLTVWDGGSAEEYKTKPVQREITIRDLLTHTSGLTYGFMQVHPVDALYRRAGLNGGFTDGLTLAESITRLSEIPLLFSPGEAWSYSLATDVCGRLIEVLSGETLDVFLEKRIFQPLGMTDTAFHVPEEKWGRFAANYEKNPKTREVRLIDKPDASSVYSKHRSYLSGGGGLVSTMSDYWRFCQMCLNGGELEGRRLVSRKTLELMTMNHLPGQKTMKDMDSSAFSETGMDGMGFGLGFSVVVNQADAQATGSLGNYSWGGAASTYFWIDPVEKITAVLMTQLMPSRAYPLRPQLQQLVYAALAD